jgi:tetratricopeptide (TPR) repeat protein
LQRIRERHATNSFDGPTSVGKNLGTVLLLPVLAFGHGFSQVSSLASSERSRRALTLAGVVCLVTLLAAELWLSVREQSPTFDEPYYLLAGYRYWQAQDFGFMPQHPPLAKLVATLPLLFLQPQVQQTASDQWYWGGWKFLYSNDAEAVLFSARVAASVLTLLLALLVFEATYRMFGRGPAFLALVLVVFEPNILAHGALVTTDIAPTLCFFAAVYAFYRYVEKPGTWRLAQCGIVAGLALAAKHSGVFVFAILGSLALLELLLARSSKSTPEPMAPVRVESVKRQAGRLAIALVVIAVIAVTVLWGMYAFRFQARPGELKMDSPLERWLDDKEYPASSRLVKELARWRVLPESYLYGLGFQLTRGSPEGSFVLGKLYPGGRWFYFPAAFPIKATLGFLLLLLLTPAARKLREADTRRKVLYLAIPAVLYFAVSLTSKVNYGVRHILPVYLFLLVIAAAGAWYLMEQHRRWAYVVIPLILFHVVSSVRSYPNYMAYSNEIWGGTDNTYKVLTDSASDWGQGLKATKRYLDQRRISQCWFAYFGPADPAYYQIPCRLLPPSLGLFSERPQEVVPQTIEGTILVSAKETTGTLSGPGEMNPYSQFQRIPPVDVIAGSVLVFEGRFGVTLASAISHLNKAGELARSKRLDQALAEAQTAVALAPRNVQSHVALAYWLAQMNRKAEARQEYQTALSLAQTVYPEYHTGWVEYLQKQISELQPAPP